MKKLIVLAVCFCFLGTAFPQDRAERERERAREINLFEFSRLAAVAPPFTGNANPVRGIGGGGAPWQIASGSAELSTTGKLEVHVHGLVLVRTGANPVANFSAILSCQSKDAAGAPSIVNLVAGTAPATAAGDAEIEGTVTLPSPCVAPIVFVAIPATATAPARWLAVSGF
jgi:hypothetical protein